MKSEPNDNSNSTRLDRILAQEEQLVPSSGFLASVMERVQEEAAIPAPIPFPWKRAFPGMVFAGGVLGWCGFELARMGMLTARAIPVSAPHVSAALIGPLEQTGWVAMALAVSLASWVLSRRLAGRSGLI